MTPEQQKAEADRLFDQGLEEYYHSQYRQALQSWQQALTIYQEIGDRSGEFYRLNNLASIYKNLLQIPQALETWQSALALSSPLKFPVQYLLIGRNLGNTAFEGENWQLAITGYEAALDALEELCHRDRSDANKQQRRRENVRVYERLVQAYLHQNQIDKALVTLERGKSRSLIELLVNRDLLPKNTPPEICQRLEQLRRELSANQRFIESLGGDIPTSGTDPDSPQSRSAGAVNIPKDDQSSFRADYWQSKLEAVTAVVELRDRYLETYNSKTAIWENQLEPFLEELAEILKINDILSKIPPISKSHERLNLCRIRSGCDRLSIYR